MTRAISLAMALLAGAAILPAAAQESGGLRLRGTQAATTQAATLARIDADRGCPLSSTTVTVGINKAFAIGSSATQRIGTVSGPSGNAGCRPLVSTQVAVGANLALGRGSQAGQSIAVQGQTGALATTTFTRGVNMAVGAGASAAQRIQNLTSR
jgi:hypothetical protein